MYEIVIGLEVHVQLKTVTKLFCGCLTEFGSQPNSHVCPVCMGLPGCLPVLNQKVLVYGIKTALALNCRIAEYTKFDRKNYFYPDLPKNYQISQYDLPLARDGFLDLKSIKTCGTTKRIRINRVHMEEDAGKLIHSDDCSLVDFNRTGIPLLEIVSYPDMNSSREAYDYLVILKQVLRYLEISSCDMEKGILRCDANVSIKKKGDPVLGTKVELKNMNSFRGVRDALDFEIKRQTKLLNASRDIIQETRLWDEQKHITVSMRTKEGSQDYRYFPEPDLPPFVINSRTRQEIGSSLPELPWQKETRFIQDYQLSEYDVHLLTSDVEMAIFFENCFRILPEAKIIANWICGPLFSELNNRNSVISELSITPENLVELIKLVREGKISNLTAKGVLTEMLDKNNDAKTIVLKKNLIQVSDTETLDKAVNEIIQGNPGSVKDYLEGKENAIMFLVGRVMRDSKGRANPKAVLEILRKKLNKPR